MLNIENHHIYICIYVKFDNNIIPCIPQLIVSYLLDNPEKVDYYLNNKIHIGMILEHLSNMYRLKGNINILEEIIRFVEGTHE